jgi:SAM-dependent methyltransferase
MVVHVCRECGLAQSRPTRERSATRDVRLSSGADWGNVRHGKGVRFDHAAFVLEREIDWPRVGRVLDIGANRGHFVIWCRKTHPDVTVTAIEPDERVVDAYRNADGISLQITRFEKATVAEGTFDLVYCSHTLEHADSARGMLEGIASALVLGGRLFLEVPNLDAIDDQTMVEEFFIDKHTFHFTLRVLVDWLPAFGLRVVVNANSDAFNITLICERVVPTGQPAPDSELARSTTARIREYAARLPAARARLKQVAEKLDALTSRQRVVIWGAGRIFDALVRFGGFNPARVKYLIDTYLAPHVSQVHGVQLATPDRLRLDTPDVVVVLARSSAGDIERLARKYGVRHVVAYPALAAVGPAKGRA